MKGFDWLKLFIGE